MNEQEVRESTLEYFKGDVLATDVWMKKYALKDKDGEFLEETPDDMHKRLASEFHRIESKYDNPLSYDEIYDTFKDFKYIVPQGGGMSGIGAGTRQSLSNCFAVAPPKDSISGIMNTARDMANIFRMRGGAGVDISTLRPDGSSVNNSAKTSTGAWSFADFFSYVTRMIGQNNRRGASMISMDVNHPDTEKFATMKADLTKVTGANISIKISDEFMRCVVNDEDYIQTFPINTELKPAQLIMLTKYNELRKFVNGIYGKKIKAKELWNTITETATLTAEPGILFWDTMVDNLPSHEYPQFETTTTNPCFSGDTLVAVADGRNAVSIRELAESGDDVPLYSVDPSTGEVTIKRGVHPRVTGTDEELYRITFDDGSTLDVTENHEFPMRDGGIKMTSELVNGDSLHSFNKRSENISQSNDKQYYRVYTNTFDSSKGKIFEHRLIAEYMNPSEWNDKYDENKKSGWLKGGLVVHHKDYDSLNNSPDNLQIMTFKEHQQFHAEKDNTGANNGRAYDVTNSEIYDIVKEETLRVGYRMSEKEYRKFAKINKLPLLFTEYRSSELKDLTTFLKNVATDCGFDNIDIDPRLARSIIGMKNLGYDCKIIGNSVNVKKTCEICGNTFWVNMWKREQATCSDLCGGKLGARTSKNSRRIKGASDKEKQVKYLSELKFKLGRFPNQTDWRKACKDKDVNSGFGATYGFSTYSDLKNAVADYNHKVVKVEKLDGTHTVYNVTVDDNHTLAVVTKITKNNKNNPTIRGVYGFQCGELPLSPASSCRLISINMKKFVDVETKIFDYDKFKSIVRIASRLSDNLVDLEIEKVTELVNSSTSDEKDLWQLVLEDGIEGRRTGLGTHGLADMFANMGIIYGSIESTDVINNIYTLFKNTAYGTSVDLAIERGPFPAYEKQYNDNLFLNNLDPDVISRMEEYGRRNVAMLTISPTGSVSIVSQVSSGIEPVFQNEYIRRRKLLVGEESENSFVGTDGENFTEYTVRHHNAEEWITRNPEQELPQEFIESHDIDWKSRVNVQSSLTRHIDHSISSCLIGGTMIDTNHGLMKIEDIVNYDGEKIEKGFYKIPSMKRFKVINHENREVPVTELFYNGVEEVMEISFKGGKTITGTPEHKLYVLNDKYGFDWVKIKDIKPGDHIVNRRNLKRYGRTSLSIESVCGKFEYERLTSSKNIVLPEYMTDGFARLLGYITSDGGLNDNGFFLSQLRNEVVDDFVYLVGDIFNLDSKIVSDPRCDGLVSVVVNSREAMRFLSHIGINKGADNKVVPRVILECCGYKATKEFIKGLTLDGFVSVDKIGIMCSISNKLLHTTELLLEGMGIYSGIVVSAEEGERVFPGGNTYKTKKSWELYSPHGYADVFMNDVGFAEKRKQLLGSRYFTHHPRKLKHGSVPDYGIREKVRGEVIPKLLNNSLYSTVSGNAKPKPFCISFETLKMFSDVGLELEDYLLDETYNFNIVKEIKQAGKQKTYDLSVDDGHSYIANGLVSHNTINLPRGTESSTVSDIYKYSWERGLKGVTVYVDGSRDGVLLKKEEDKKENNLDEQGRPLSINRVSSPARPRVLECDIHSLTAKGERFTVVVGLMDGEPYEVFAMPEISSLRNCETGTIKKVSKGHYDLESGDIVVESFTDIMTSDEEIAITRMVSLALRHGADMGYIVDSLNKANGLITSFSKAVARTLKKYSNVDTSVDMICPTCGSSNYRLENGCSQCYACGFSKCG